MANEIYDEMDAIDQATDMSEKDDTTVFGYHVVCLIDVLGQKQKLARWASLPDGGQITPDFIDALKQTAGIVLSFRSQFIDYFKRLSQCTMPEKLVELPKAQQERYQRLKNCEVPVERFSDTFVFSSQIGSSHGDASVTPMYRILGTCCYAMLVSLAAKLPVRGAVTVGAGGMLEDGSFYGPALAEAHQLESEVAKYPRVVVSQTACEFLADGQAYSMDRETAEIMGKIAGICRSFIWQDVDGCWIVDFLGEGLRDLLGSNTGMTVAVKMAYDFVRAQAEQFRKSKNVKLALRYHLLQQYIESRLHLWGIQANG